MEVATALTAVVKGGAEEVLKWLPLIGDLAATTGLSLRDTTSQFIRMYSAGAAAADMFRERGVLAMLGFKAGAKYSAEETMRIMEEEWKSSTSKFRGATDELAKTWDGTMSMLSDAWFLFRNKVMQAGVFEYLTDKLRILLGNVNDLKDKGKLDEWAGIVAEKFLNLAKITEDTLFPAVKKVGNIMKELWGIFDKLPGWVKEYGIIGAFLWGKLKLVLSVAGAGAWLGKKAAEAHMNWIKKYIPDIKEQGKSFKEFRKSVEEDIKALREAGLTAEQLGWGIKVEGMEVKKPKSFEKKPVPREKRPAYPKPKGLPRVAGVVGYKSPEEITRQQLIAGYIPDIQITEQWKDIQVRIDEEIWQERVERTRRYSRELSYIFYNAFTDRVNLFDRVGDYLKDMLKIKIAEGIASGIAASEWYQRGMGWFETGISSLFGGVSENAPVRQEIQRYG